MASFTPLVFAASDGIGKAATVFYKWLTTLLAQKYHDMYRQCACLPIIIRNDYENINHKKICLFQNHLNSPEWLDNSDMIEVRTH